MLTDEQVNQLIGELEKKLVLDRGIQCRNLRETFFRGGRKEDKVYARSDTISGKGLGDFRHIIKEYVVDITIWLTEDLTFFAADPQFFYKHIPCGTNGHGLGFRITGKVGDDWTHFKTEFIGLV